MRRPARPILLSALLLVALLGSATGEGEPLRRHVEILEMPPPAPLQVAVAWDAGTPYVEGDLGGSGLAVVTEAGDCDPATATAFTDAQGYTWSDRRGDPHDVLFARYSCHDGSTETLWMARQHAAGSHPGLDRDATFALALFTCAATCTTFDASAFDDSDGRSGQDRIVDVRVFSIDPSGGPFAAMFGS